MDVDDKIICKLIKEKTIIYTHIRRDLNPKTILSIANKYVVGKVKRRILELLTR